MTDLLSPETDLVDTAERPAVADRPERPRWNSASFFTRFAEHPKGSKP